MMNNKEIKKEIDEQCEFINEILDGKTELWQLNMKVSEKLQINKLKYVVDKKEIDFDYQIEMVKNEQGFFISLASIICLTLGFALGYMAGTL